ncbi:tRNA (adenosine(37)-N6)-threonylcarbamoyltransferase complex ATPase subunit type 1 TsaE [bacterium]|nr:tRNA (adenosine(37)-N6)-threonylcarbamoyltransferase complex ATPase subunit type 1 TsaE [bacterium]
MMNKKEIISKSIVQTQRIGKKMARCLRQGDVVALSGDLGSGKTSFSCGISSGLGIVPNTFVHSPTFTLVNEYCGKMTIFHLDLYRISSPDEFFLSGLDECFSRSAVTIIEWADKLKSIIPDNALWVYLKFVDESTRTITIVWSDETHPLLSKEFL